MGICSLFASCTCSTSLTRSIGATIVLETAPAVPPAARSFAKLRGREAGDEAEGSGGGLGARGAGAGRKGAAGGAGTHETGSKGFGILAGGVAERKEGKRSVRAGGGELAAAILRRHTQRRELCDSQKRKGAASDRGAGAPLTSKI
jgi:hypothetical protein